MSAQGIVLLPFKSPDCWEGAGSGTFASFGLISDSLDSASESLSPSSSMGSMELPGIAQLGLHRLVTGQMIRLFSGVSGSSNSANWTLSEGPETFSLIYWVQRSALGVSKL